jgi:hypothetical protein
MFLTTPSSDLAFGQLADDLGALFGAAFFQNRAARHHDIAAAAVHLQNLERLLQPHQRAGIAHGAHIDLRTGQERHSAAQIDGEATLDAAKDRAIDALFRRIGFFQTVPSGFAAGLLAADNSLAAGVFDALEIDLDLVAHGEMFGASPGLANSLISTRPSIL